MRMHTYFILLLLVQSSRFLRVGLVSCTFFYSTTDSSIASSILGTLRCIPTGLMTCQKEQWTQGKRLQYIPQKLPVGCLLALQ